MELFLYDFKSCKKISKDGGLESIDILIRKFFLFEYNGFMWFFIPLILIYISMPFFAVFVLNSDRKLLRFFLILGGIMGLVPPLQIDFTLKNDFTDIYLMGSRFLYFIVAGYYLGHFKLSRKTCKMLYVASFSSMLVMSLGTYFLSLYWPEHYRYFISYVNLPCTISAMGVFVFFREFDWSRFLKRFRINVEVLSSISRLSLGIYLIQLVWLMVLSHYNICEDRPILKFLFMYLLCTSSVYVMQRLPLIKRMVI